MAAFRSISCCPCCRPGCGRTCCCWRGRWPSVRQVSGLLPLTMHAVRSGDVPRWSWWPLCTPWSAGGSQQRSSALTAD